MEAGCDGYIPKPAEPRLVLAMVWRYLGRTGRGGNGSAGRRLVERCRAFLGQLTYPSLPQA